MMKDSTAEDKNKIYQGSLTANFSLQKIIAVWAFSESSFGGILHAFKIPFRGIFISSAAVIFITLIAFYSKQSKAILKSTLIVLLIKALVSPHTPITAYFAVSLQGILGYVLFLSKRFFRISALILGILTLLFSGAQKIILLTLLFGNTLWKSINIFIGEVTNLFTSTGISSDFNYGYLLIEIYLLIHLVAGILIGIYAGKLPEKIRLDSKMIMENKVNYPDFDILQNDRKKKRNWFQRPTGLLILLLSIALLIFSYLSPSGIGIQRNEIIFMLVRSLIITVLWLVIIAPILRRLFQKFLLSRKSGYAQEMDKIINVFPQFRKILSYCWSNSSNYSGVKRIYNFISTSFYLLLISETE